MISPPSSIRRSYYYTRLENEDSFYFRFFQLIRESGSAVSFHAAQHCVGAGGTEVIGESSVLSATAQLHR